MSNCATVIVAGTITTAVKVPLASVVTVGVVRVIETGVASVVLAKFMVTALFAA